MPPKRPMVVVALLICTLLALPVSAQSGAARSKSRNNPTVRLTTSFENIVLRATSAHRLEILTWPEFNDKSAQVRKFYDLLKYRMAWVENSQPTERAKEMVEVLERAESEGLTPEDYDGPRWERRLARLGAAHSPENEYEFDLALTVSAMRYLSDIHLGRIDPRPFRVLDGNTTVDLASYLNRLRLGSADLVQEVAALEPQTPSYRETRRALLRYLELAKQIEGAKLPPPVGVVYRGGYYDHMPALASRLRQLGDLAPDADVSPDATVYGGALMDAVQRFQQRHGLPPTGNLTAETIAQINVPLRTRVEQLRLSLERARWPSTKKKQPYIVINLPEYRLTAYDENGREALSMSVTVGDAYDFQTPVFQDAIRYVVFRPYWYMTQNILRNEILPDISQSNFLNDNDLEVITREGQLVTSDEINGKIISRLRAGTLKLRQKPGPENALGLVKISFPNPYDIYMHDSPERRSLFSELGSRAESHGCIHLERPAQLAQWLLRDKPEWTLERVIKNMQDGPDDFNVYLTRPVPILITYQTASVSPDGEVHFYADIYGHDAQLEQALSRDHSGVKTPAEALVYASNP